MPSNVFITGEYLEKVPQWHTEDSSWKAKGVIRVMERNRISPRIIGEVGCGAGEVLRQLQSQMDPDCLFWGYDISPAAIDLCRPRENDRLRFTLGDVTKERSVFFDVLLVLDLLEHQENYFKFLREIKPLAPYKLFHQVLDLSVYTVLKKHGLTSRRYLLEDLHFFTKDLVLMALTEEGYDILDWFYAPRSIYRSSRLIEKIRQIPRAFCFAFHKDLAVRLMGGYTLYVLAK